MTSTSNLEEIPEFRKHQSLNCDDRSISIGSSMSNRREASPTIHSFKHLRNYRLEAKAQQKRENSVQKEEQIESFLGKVTELEAEWNTQKSQTPSVQFLTSMGSKILNKQDLYRSSQVSSPTSITLNSIHTDRPLYEPLFAQKTRDPKVEQEQDQLFVFKDDVIPEKPALKKMSKSINPKKDLNEKTDKIKSPRGKVPVFGETKTLLSKKQSYQAEPILSHTQPSHFGRASPKRFHTTTGAEDEQFVIACQPSLFTKSFATARKPTQADSSLLTSPKNFLQNSHRISMERIEDRSSMISTASESKERVHVIPKKSKAILHLPADKNRAESPIMKKPKTADSATSRLTGTPNAKKAVAQNPIKSKKVIDFPLPTEPAKIKAVVKKTVPAKDANKHFVITQADLKANMDSQNQKENDYTSIKVLEVPRETKKAPLKCPASPNTKLTASPGGNTNPAPSSGKKTAAPAKESVKLSTNTPLSEKKSSAKKGVDLNERDKLYNDILEKLDREHQKTKVVTVA